jgi:hypothetical protein
MDKKSFYDIGSRENVIKLFCPYLTNFCNKLVCLFLASFSSLVNKHISFVLKFINYSFITLAQDRIGEQGFECGPQLCVSASNWCNHGWKKIYGHNKLVQTCPEFIPTMNSERLCRNKTFWGLYYKTFYGLN